MAMAVDCGVLIVDDDSNLRALLADVLGRAGFPVSACGSGEEALERAAAEPPRVVILDVNLPGVSGYGVCRELRERFGDAISILFLSGERVEAFDRVAGLLLGADDYLTKPFVPEELVARVNAIIRRMPSQRPAGLLKRLTRRELEVLRLLADGLRQQQIADRLVISPRTVATHVEHILGKLGAHSRAEAVAVAYREDLFDTSTPV